MTEKYVQLMEDLQYARRQLQSFKQKQAITQQQLSGAREENKELRKTVERLQQTNSKLVRTNRQLSEEKESIASDYSTQISEIKQQIVRKQKQITELKQITSPTIVNQELAIRQLRFQLTQQYAHDIAIKDQKISELGQLNERLSYEKEIEKEKYTLKINSLQAHLKELQTKHQAQLQQCSVKLFQLSQTRPPEEREILRRAKRDNEQLKRRLDFATAELSATLEQKNKVHNDYREWMTKYQKQLGSHQQETQTYKEEIVRLTELVDKKSSKREQLVIKERDREIKKLKGQLEEMRDEIVSKEKKISDLEVEKAKIQSEIKILKNQQDKVISKVEQADRWEIERLQKELLEARTLLQKLRGQNFQLNDRIHEANRTAFDSKRHFEHLKKEEENARYQLRRQVSEEAFKSKSRIIQQSKVEPVYQNEDEAKKLEEALRGEKGKLRDFLAKYIDLKKKYQILEGKLKTANEKIMQLLRDKIVLGSPKASGKTFEFPTEPQRRVTPPKHQQHRINQLAQRTLGIDGEDTVINSIQDPKFMTTAQFKHRGADTHSKTNPSFNRQFMSPQDNRHIRIQDESIQSCNERSFYQKSLKIKNQRFRELKCTNHSHQKQRNQSNERV